MNPRTGICDVCYQPHVPTVTVIDWLAPHGERVCVQCWPTIRQQMDTRHESDRLNHRERWRQRLHLPDGAVTARS